MHVCERLRVSVSVSASVTMGVKVSVRQCVCVISGGCSAPNGWGTSVWSVSVRGA